MLKLNSIEIRVISALIEKEITTPEYYPLTLNSLLNACNQKSSRFPVVSYDEEIVQKIVEGLREKKLVARVTGDNIRTPKYKQNFTEELNLNKAETAILTLLMLRGAQTPGELKNRSGRMYEFKDLMEVHEVLERLLKREEPLVKILPKEAGMKESRFVHLFSDEESENINEVTPEENKLEKMEEEINNLKAEIEKLKIQFEAFRKQFE